MGTTRGYYAKKVPTGVPTGIPTGTFLAFTSFPLSQLAERQGNYPWATCSCHYDCFFLHQMSMIWSETRRKQSLIIDTGVGDKRILRGETALATNGTPGCEITQPGCLFCSSSEMVRTETVINAILQAQESISQYCICLVAFLEQIYSISACLAADRGLSTNMVSIHLCYRPNAMNKRRKASEAAESRLRKLPKNLSILPSNSACPEDISFKQHEVDIWDRYTSVTPIKNGYHYAMMKDYPFSSVLVKEACSSSERVFQLRSAPHRNLLHLQHIYTKEKSIFMVYEMSVASLKDILGFRPYWDLADTAAVCHGILCALKYMHGSLGISHGNLSLDTIRLHWTGTIKIANIGDCLLQSDQEYTKDIEAFESIVGRLIEGHESDDAELKDFRQALHNKQPASALLQHKFLRKSNGEQQLQRSVETWLSTRIPFPRFS
ncbi:uncharacterized protein BO96DRAFT_440042 [Aspergillus niger CBS 101883]|uniref:uncharacterized protein n=1 Tax=Aspergillus lacticoffeatus (strain CBS 101883) TaxID=1450533 RepID=UPI000D7F44AC|nr:uncharacterized protein BO96DRAFT_440042 [Aspergillus niger CBS 101883]PYH50312.1 hypothetical protein BO96DRAFT_440042 [Aspergillus niger CBS 101883]